MAGVNIANSNLTFTRYLDGVVETLNQESKARNLIRQDDEWAGDKIEFRVHTARNHAVGNVEDGGAFPVADKQDYQTCNAYRKFTVGAIQLTDGVMAAARKSPNVARDAVTSEVEGMMQGILKYENGMFFRNGDGHVAVMGTDVTCAAGGNFTCDDARMLWDGATYDVYDTTLATNRGTVQITSVDPGVTAAGEMTVNATTALPSGTIQGDKLVWNGSLNRAMTGLDKLIEDSTVTSFQGLAISTYQRYSSLVLDNGGTARDLTPQLFRQMLAGIKQKSGNERPAEGLKVLCSNWQAMNVEELYEGEIRMTPESTVAGMAVAAFQTALGRVDIITDADALYKKMFFIDPSKIYRAIQKRLSWRREENGGIFKRSDTAGVWTATAIEIAEMYIKERHTSGKITDLNETIKTAY